jgi:hypothetical protein
MTCTIEGNNFVGSLLEPLLKKVTPVVGSRMFCRFSLNKINLGIADVKLEYPSQAT